MIRHFFTICLLLFFHSLLWAQIPRNITISEVKHDNPTRVTPKMECLNDAGTIQTINPIGQSNDLSYPNFFMCANDRFTIDHLGDFNLSSDPDSSTQPGIVYAFYNDIPTISGPTLADIQGDPNLNTTDPITIGGVSTPLSDEGIWVAGVNPNGDLTIINDGFIQEAFNNGAPTLLWFAPLTIDNFADLEYERETAQGPPGPCVNANINQAFSIVYLNEIQIPFTSNSISSSGCRGAFSVTGGLPEFNNGDVYNITIRLQSDPTVTVSPTSLPSHGDTVEFIAPQPGVYEVIVEDGKSCGASTTIDMSGCRSITMDLEFLNANPGATNVCMDLTVGNFQNVGAFQFSLNWDQNVIQYNSTQNLNPNVPGLNFNSINESSVNNGQYSFIWPTSLGVNSANLADGEVLLEICFDVIGDLGEESPVSFTDNPTQIQFGDDDVVAPNDLGYFLNDGQINISNNTIFVDLEADSVRCFGEANGGILVRLGEGTPPYEVFYEQLPATGNLVGPLTVPAGQSQLPIINLVAGDYEVIVQDNIGTEIRDTISVAEPERLGARPFITDAACFGDSIPEIRIEVRTGSTRVDDPESIYTFTWDTPFGNGLMLNSSVLTNVPEGTYSVTVSDSKGCQAISASSVFSPDEITVPDLNIAITDATCTGAEDGMIEITATGGTSTSGDYAYSWQNGTMATNVSSLNNNLDPGVYYVTITDDNNCEAIDSFFVSADKLLSLNISSVDIDCFGDSTGTVLANIATSVGVESLPYTFSWEDALGNAIPGNSTGERSNEVNDLPAGTYFLTVADNDPIGCQISDSIEIIQPDSLVAELLNQVDETCENGGGAMDGSATIEVSGGTFPYDYLWTNMEGDTVGMDSFPMMLSADTLNVRVQDINGCLDSIEVIINAPPPPFITSITGDNLECFNDVDGMVSVDIAPTGTAVEFIEWLDVNGNRVALGETADNLSPGVYFARVMGVNECASLDSAIVTAPSPLFIDSIPTLSTPICPGDNNGIIAVQVSGGNDPYTYRIQGQGLDETSNSPRFEGLVAGVYEITVFDGNNCEERMGSKELFDPPSIVISFSEIDSTSCFENVNDGGATASANYSDGTTGMFTFSWASSEMTSGVSTSRASLLRSGFNSITVNDGVCPAVIDSVNVPSPPEISSGIVFEDISCNGLMDGSASLNPSGGVGNFTFEWFNGSTTNSISGLAVGGYNVLITDGNGCFLDQPFLIREPNPLSAESDPAFTRDESCQDAEDGVIALTVLGGTPAYTYFWNNGATTESIEELSAGSYSVTVTDANNCQDSLVVEIVEPTPIMAVVPQPQPPLCFGDPAILTVDTVFGGAGSSSADYMYSVNNSGIFFPIDQPSTLFRSENIIIIEDLNGCTITDTITIQQPELVEITFDPSRVVVELGDSTVQLNPIINANDGVPIDSFVWSPADFLSANNIENPIVAPLESREYTLRVIDANGCEAVNSIFVELDANRNVNIPTAFSPNGDGDNDDFSIFTCNGVSEIVSARIFDRWGELLHESTGLSPNCEAGFGVKLWDGTFNGSELNPGVYVYIIEVEFIDGINLVYRGSIALIK